MEDKTPIYMVLVVGIVALVGLIMVISHGSSDIQSSQTIDTPSNVMTANVVADTQISAASLNGFGKLFFAIFLLGVAGYMYFRKEYTWKFRKD